MKRIAILLASLLSALSLSAQGGGREVLTMVAERLAKMGAYRIDFELEMSSAAETSKGHCMVSGPLYLIAIDGVGGMDGMKQGFDGEKVWTYDGIAKEVAYDNPNLQSRSLFDNPTKAFDFSEEHFSVVGAEDDGKGGWLITLEPRKGVLDGIKYVVLTVDRQTSLPVRLGYDMAGAVIYINISAIAPLEASPADFELKVPQEFEVIDFR